MALRITNLRLPVEHPDGELDAAIMRRLGILATDLKSWRILRKSLDARSRTRLEYVYTILVDAADEAALSKLVRSDSDISQFEVESFFDPPNGKLPSTHRPVVVGSGPAGLVAAYYLALRGYAPLILERGRPVKERVPAIRSFDNQHGPHDPENNYLFGEGGAGAFSDGKLTCRMSGPDVDWVLQSFVECGGRASILYELRPHLGSNKLPMICRNFRRKIEALGGTYQFGCRVDGLRIQDGVLTGVETSTGFIATQQVILATGHSARDTYEMLHRTGLPMQQKAFQLGLRIEQPQEQVNKWKYGKPEYLDLLGAADYSLAAKGNRDVFSFCMCAGGIIIPSISEPNQFCTNGMSNSKHDTPFANSGIMATLHPHEFGSDHPLAGVEIQRRFELKAFEIGRSDYLCPIQTANDFIAGKWNQGASVLDCSYARGTVAADLREVLPVPISKAIAKALPIMDKKFRGEFLKNAILVGPEMRGSAPLRMDRDTETRQVPGLRGVYPVGEGAGYAGGIVSAAVDGLRSAREIVRMSAPVG
ncbi:MAG: FAD-dependent oxidoreductase [Planctomycetaceae bacterium]|nr:FAD-dependent oxidoreductase [Planctomycetaceae bacterium]